jgi:hypothetical protein
MKSLRAEINYPSVSRIKLYGHTYGRAVGEHEIERHSLPSYSPLPVFQAWRVDAFGNLILDEERTMQMNQRKNPESPRPSCLEDKTPSPKSSSPQPAQSSSPLWLRAKKITSEPRLRQPKPTVRSLKRDVQQRLAVTTQLREMMEHDISLSRVSTRIESATGNHSSKPEATTNSEPSRHTENEHTHSVSSDTLRSTSSKHSEGVPSVEEMMTAVAALNRM